MLWTGAVHPPGGALVLIFADSHRMQALGARYVLYPGLAGAMLLMVAAALTDELVRDMAARRRAARLGLSLQKC